MAKLGGGKSGHNRLWRLHEKAIFDGKELWETAYMYLLC